MWNTTGITELSFYLKTFPLAPPLTTNPITNNTTITNITTFLQAQQEASIPASTQPSLQFILVHYVPPHALCRHVAFYLLPRNLFTEGDIDFLTRRNEEVGAMLHLSLGFMDMYPLPCCQSNT